MSEYGDKNRNYRKREVKDKRWNLIKRMRMILQLKRSFIV